MRAEATPLPLCVDLDGTLVRTDLTLESLLSAFKQAPWIVFLVPFWLLQGKARLKDELARRAEVDASLLPYNETVVDMLRSAREQGRQVVLATGSHRVFAHAIQDHLGLIDRVIATEDDLNLTGARKAEVLNDAYGSGAYEYVANEAKDLHIWRESAAAVTVGAPPSVVQKVAHLGIPHEDIEVQEPAMSTWFKAIRIHQWLKNALIFVPLLTAHSLFDIPSLIACGLAFLAFGLCASATYIFNDLLDLDADRHHETKRARPFASGALSIVAGIVTSCGLLLAGVLISLMLPPLFQLALVAYIVSTVLYSLWLKRVASLDVLVLACLYTLRVIAGGFAAGLPMSFWLLAFSMFVFLCLAMVKRVSELVRLREKLETMEAGEAVLKGREYNVEDIPVLQNMGASSGYLAVLVLALYINSEEVLVLYKTPEILWLIAPLLLLWITRIWIVTSRGYMDQDPIFFSIKDPETWFTAAATGLIIVAATLLDLS